MRRLRLAVQVCAVVLGVAVAASAQAPPDVVAAARREGRVVVYGSLEADAFDVIRKIYEQRYGVPVEYWRAASTRVLDRALAEHRSGRGLFDVVLTNAGPMRILKAQGVFQKYVSPTYEDFPPATRDRDGILSPSYRMVVISVLYNTRLVRPEEAPRTYADLLDPKWRGKMVMPDPTLHTTTATWLVNLRRVLGAQWRPFVERLGQQVGLVESFLPVVQKLVAGEYALGITYVKYVKQFSEAPLDYVRLNPVLADAHLVGLARNAPHPNAGKLLIDTLTSRAGLHALAQTGEFVLVPGIYPPIKDADKLRVVLMEDLDEQEFRKARDELGPLFRRR
ncbi:MAG: substrate-binding domain-containing protein [Armatimonadota bacterium]|nr:substrate-binding domain-containing protein [Armatimonadota bacterium]MDR5676442.1 substrate-binding domain-containing protein [Armatimonadota bacterium]MDR5689420.1 substrate-binding domain-containing protein [Armatimonadota bacterium]MDR7386832.1 substrate-binding domain-containing protein [Armatimonadota bacterium]MDR7389130.1 substrate-binding domain-containing protein [Armatimonadota bacterium]